jgi:glycosyltransferase involved in cell wall biosynthesis
MNVCHITTIHPERDVRIFHKECKSLAKAGYDVKLIVVNGDSFIEDGVEVVGVPGKYSGRLQRFSKAPKAALKKALEINADIYHFHDPEFLPSALKLKKNGKKVVYDVHEDVPRQILSKYWIPKPVRKLISVLVEKFENRIARKLDFIVTATPFIRERFLVLNKNTIDINNFPVYSTETEIPEWESRKQEICYIGSLTEVRGIKEMVNAFANLKNVSLNLAGKYSPEEFREDLVNTEGWKKVKEYGFINRKQAKEIMDKSQVGLVTLYPIINYIDSLPVKMFEYMGAGIPVIASDFPLWKDILEANDCGICVDPLNPKKISDAIKYLIENPGKAKQMGLNGKKLVEEKYNWQIEEAKLIKLYNNLIKD